MLITDNKILIDALKRNYKYFLVPTRNVNPPKKNRIYCAKDLADLDIKTGTNKIGEIVNLSQELNSLLWDKVYKIGKPVGECFHEIEDIYYDACQLDVMSNIEIDSAKKEYSVSNVRELQKLRDKYAAEFTNYNKKVKPKFLGFIAQTKGYYDPKHKSYLHHHTSMDYLLKYINGFQSKQYKKYNNLSLSEIFKPTDYNSKAVRGYQIDEILSDAKDLSNKIRALGTKNFYSKNEKSQIIQLLKQVFYNKVNKTKLNKHTIFQLLKIIEEQKNINIKSLIFYTLFNFNNENIKELMRDFEKVESYIIENPDGNIDLIGGKYTRIK